jgi:phosphoglycolate phosphatase-like HAD superfamily hydrolase
MHKLILWDIDGTLLYTDGIASEEMRRAMGKVFAPVERRERTFFSGKTDWQIILDSFEGSLGLTSEDVAKHMPEFCVTYTSFLDSRRDDLLQRAKVLPGVMTVLEQLHNQAVQAPLTGNVAPVARLKLELLGLLPYLNYDIGGYGNDHRERAELVRIAASRAEQQYGKPFRQQDIVIVGDTPKDIACARANGARTVIVATGAHSYEELLQYGPDVLLEDLSDTDAAIAAILGGNDE